MEDNVGRKEWVGYSEILFGAVAEMFGEGDSDTGVFGVWHDKLADEAN